MGYFKKLETAEEVREHFEARLLYWAFIHRTSPGSPVPEASAYTANTAEEYVRAWGQRNRGWDSYIYIED